MFTRLLFSATRLRKHALEAIREGKKALAHATKYLPSDGKLPSGTTVNDLVKHILDEMWKEKYIDLNKSNPSPPTMDPRPGTWVFPGYVAFAYFGCPILCPDGERLSVFAKDAKDLDKKKNTGRRVIRQEEAASDTTKRTYNSANFGNRGLNTDQELRLSELHQQRIMALQSQERTEIHKNQGKEMALNEKFKRNLEQYKSAMDTVSFWERLGKTDKMNKAVEEVEKYQRQKELLESEAEKLANTDIEETESFKKRRTLIDSLLNEEEIDDNDGDMNPHNISVRASPGSNVSAMTLQTAATTTATTRGENPPTRVRKRGDTGSSSDSDSDNE